MTENDGSCFRFRKRVVHWNLFTRVFISDHQTPLSQTTVDSVAQPAFLVLASFPGLSHLFFATLLLLCFIKKRNEKQTGEALVQDWSGLSHLDYCLFVLISGFF